MYDYIEIFAGHNALKIIQEKGLDKNDIRAVVGASGGPKFLILAGIDRILLNTWFKERSDTLLFLGSSIGAWRGAAYASSDPAKYLDIFTESYLKQIYTTKPS